MAGRARHPRTRHGLAVPAPADHPGGPGPGLPLHHPGPARPRHRPAGAGAVGHRGPLPSPGARPGLGRVVHRLEPRVVLRWAAPRFPAASRPAGVRRCHRGVRVPARGHGRHPCRAAHQPVGRLGWLRGLHLSAAGGHGPAPASPPRRGGRRAVGVCGDPDRVRARSPGDRAGRLDQLAGLPGLHDDRFCRVRLLPSGRRRRRRGTPRGQRGRGARRRRRRRPGTGRCCTIRRRSSTSSPAASRTRGWPTRCAARRAWRRARSPPS